MKKLFNLVLAAILLGSWISCKQQDPLRYKGCIVVNKDDRWLQLKLTSEMREELHKDYLWIYTTKEDAKYFNIGDTIK
jgi:hypothetical protein